MINLRLQRLALFDDVTLGSLAVGNTPWFFTVERPWLNNAPFVSCIPAGQYPWKWVDTGTAGNRHGRGIGIEDVDGRTLIRIHIANVASQVEGCVGVGMTRHDYRGGVRGVGSSTEALEKLMDMLEGEHGMITILNP